MRYGLRIRYGLLVFVVLLSSGCGSSLVQVKGKVTRNGQAIAVADRERLQVILYPWADAGEKADDVFPANVRHSEGTFAVPGKSGKGIPPGKYRISVEILGPLDADTLKGQFAKEKSPFVRELSAGSQEVVLDLDKPMP